MTLETFIKNYGSLALSLGAAFAVYVVWSKLAIARLEGRASILEKHNEAQDKALSSQSDCIKSLQAKESDEKVRAYRADESDKKLDSLARQVTEGFAEIRGAIAAGNLQNVQIIGEVGNLKKSTDKLWQKHERLERIIAEAGLASAEGADEP